MPPPDFSGTVGKDVQHVIDQRKKMFGAFINLFQTTFYLRLDILLQSDVGKSYDSVHRCSDIMISTSSWRLNCELIISLYCYG